MNFFQKDRTRVHLRMDTPYKRTEWGIRRLTDARGWRESSLGIGRLPIGGGDIRWNVAANRGRRGVVRREREGEKSSRPGPAKISRDPPRPVKRCVEQFECNFVCAQRRRSREHASEHLYRAGSVLAREDRRARFVRPVLCVRFTCVA